MILEIKSTTVREREVGSVGEEVHRAQLQQLQENYRLNLRPRLLNA